MPSTVFLVTDILYHNQRLTLNTCARLNLRGDARRRYMAFFSTHDPALIPTYEALLPYDTLC